MNEAEELMATAQKQLEEHREWLALEIEKIPITDGDQEARKSITWLAAQARSIKLRLVKASGTTVSVVYEYPDELYAYLSRRAPQHLRDTLAGGHAVDPNQPAFTAKREVSP